MEVIEHAANRLSLVADTIKKCGIKKMVMESCMTVDEYFPLKEKMGDIDVVFEQEYFLEQRMVKDAEEIACTKAAIAAAEAGFDKLLPRLKTGMTEKDLADELHYLVSKEGAEARALAQSLDPVQEVRWHMRSRPPKKLKMATWLLWISVF